jgi:AcrR family transcriptional regulator
VAKVKKVKKENRIGRPREFDSDRALDRALDVFWRQGYEGTSMSDLTKAMKINRPSLYAAFGDKETLFRRALDRYAEGPASYATEALKLPSARDAVEALLRGALYHVTDRRYPKGCLLIQGALACGKEADSVREELIARRAKGEEALRARLKKARRDGDLPAEVDPSTLAQFYITVMHGMGVQAASGASKAELERVVETAMKAWPEQVRSTKDEGRS